MESESQKCAVRKREESGEKKAERRKSRDMQSCSIHHCVLLLLTLTFTTALVAAGDCPTLAKLHQRVTLPCTHKCDGETKWTLHNNRSVVFARCDQTSCSSVVDGYEMSHDQYLKGDFSLTITSAEYSMRNTYVCECRTRDYSTVRLSIETVFSAVQKNPGEDLILDLTVPEPVEVIYTSSDSADGEQICNVTQHSRQCKAEYNKRTSLSYPELTLRDVTYSDSGRYTIRNTEYKEDIRVYAVSVTGLSKGMTALIVLLVLVLVLVICGVIIYKWREAEKRRKVENEKEAVVVEIKQVFKLLQQTNQRTKLQVTPNQGTKLQVNKSIRKMKSVWKSPEEVESEMNEVEKKIKEVEKMIGDLEKRYRENSKYKDDVGLFCYNKRGDLEVCRNLSKTILNESRLDPVKLMVMMMMMGGVLDDLENLKRSVSVQSRSSLCTQVDSDLKYIKSRCKKMRDDLQSFKENPGDEANVELKTDTEALLSAVETWCGEKEKELQKYTHQPVSTERSENQSVELDPLNSNV